VRCDYCTPEMQRISAADAADATAQVNLDVCAAVVMPASRDPAVLAREIIRAQDWSSKKLAYLAAAINAGELPAFTVGDLPPEHRADWNDYIAATWSYRLAGYAKVPDALAAVTVGSLAKAVDRLAVVERHYLRSMGFHYKELRAGWGFYRVKDDRLFDERMARAVEEVARRQATEEDAADVA
jgi:hypothetical protein